MVPGSKPVRTWPSVVPGLRFSKVRTGGAPIPKLPAQVLMIILNSASRSRPVPLSPGAPQASCIEPSIGRGDTQIRTARSQRVHGDLRARFDLKISRPIPAVESQHMRPIGQPEGRGADRERARCPRSRSPSRSRNRRPRP